MWPNEAHAEEERLGGLVLGEALDLGDGPGGVAFVGQRVAVGEAGAVRVLEEQAGSLAPLTLFPETSSFVKKASSRHVCNGSKHPGQGSGKKALGTEQ